MAAKADKFDLELDELGQNTVVGQDLLKYFRQNYCIYLTQTMFEYLSKQAVSLSEQQVSSEVNLYSLASTSAVLKLIKCNLRCLAICKLSLDDILSETAQESFNQMRSKFNADFCKGLREAVGKRADAAQSEKADGDKADPSINIKDGEKTRDGDKLAS